MRTIWLCMGCILYLCTLNSCKNENPKIPDESVPVKEKVAVYPDYTDIVVPPNIAPLNMEIKSAGDDFVVALQGASKTLVAASSPEGKIQFDPTAWTEMLKKNRGQTIRVTCYAHRNGQWVRFPSYNLYVAGEDIDRYVSYRLIEPGYELYRQLGLYQRDLTTFTQYVIYENDRNYDHTNTQTHCVNCHNYQNYSTKKMLFHVRGNHGGTIIAENGKIKKLNLKSDSILSSAVYPTWYPNRAWIAFSSNKTGQVFHLLNHQKIEVLDIASDLIFYDAEKNVLKNILKTKYEFETFPCWSPDGKKLYFCRASMPQLKSLPDSLIQPYIVSHYDSLRYDVMSMTFDPGSQSFGTPTLEVDCKAMKKSASVPRVSPDGKFLLFTLGDYGQFHIWHKSSDLYVKNLETGQTYPLTASNSPDVDSYHGWSSNGRWIIFSSRRDDGSYTRLYIAYFDRNGQSHKAFLLPQKDPDYNLALLKSYNVPEFTKDKVPYSPKEFRKAIMGEATPVNFK